MSSNVNDWRSVPIGALFRRIEERGHPDLPLLSVYRELGVVPREGREDNFNRPGDDLSAYKRVRVGDLVLNKMKTWQGSLGIADHEGIVSPAYFVGRQVAPFNRRFLHHQLRSAPLIAEYGARSKGIRPSQWDLPWDEFKSIRVLLPPDSDQSRIANFLDAETAHIDALIEKKQRMNALLTEALDAWIEDSIRRFAVGEVPLRRLLAAPPQYGATESGETGEESWPRYIRITDLNADGSLRSDDIRRLSPAVARPFQLDDGDILVARSGATVGKPFIYRATMGPACFAGYLIRLRFDRTLALPGLIEAWARTTQYWGQIRVASVQATIENVSAERYKELRVPVLPLEMQQGLLDEVTARRAITARLVRALTDQVDLLQERRQTLIAAAVTGQLSIPGVVG